MLCVCLCVCVCGLDSLPQIFNFWFLLSTSSNIALLVYCGYELTYGVMFRDMTLLKFPLGLGCGLSWISAVQVRRKGRSAQPALLLAVLRPTHHLRPCCLCVLAVHEPVPTVLLDGNGSEARCSNDCECTYPTAGLKKRLLLLPDGS